VRHVRLPSNTLLIRGQAVCASIKGLPFEPCFNLDKKDEVSFRGSVSGMGFAYCDFHHQGGTQMLMARAVAHPRSLHPAEQARSVDESHSEASSHAESGRSEPARSESAKSESVKSESEPAKPDGAMELRHSTE